MRGLDRSYALMTVRQRIVGLVVAPLAVWLVVLVTLGLLEPVRSLECRRDEPGAPGQCVATRSVWLREPTRAAFTIDGAAVELDRVEADNRRGRSTRGHVRITPVAGEPVVLDHGGARLVEALRAFAAGAGPATLRDDRDWRGFMFAALPAVALLFLGPMAALGGRLHVRVAGDALELVRSRLGVRGRAHRVPLVAGRPPPIVARRLTGRSRGSAALLAVHDGREEVIVAYARADVLAAIAADLQTVRL